MKINGNPYDLPRPVGPSTGPAGVPGRKETQPESTPTSARQSSRSDSVEISSAGRALAGAESTEGALTPERLAELRRRVLEGAYNSVEIADQVARRILDRGDV